jgi:hypothetical protein
LIEYSSGGVLCRGATGIAGAPSVNARTSGAVTSAEARRAARATGLRRVAGDRDLDAARGQRPKA